MSLSNVSRSFGMAETASSRFMGFLRPLLDRLPFAAAATATTTATSSAPGTTSMSMSMGQQALVRTGPSSSHSVLPLLQMAQQRQQQHASLLRGGPSSFQHSQAQAAAFTSLSLRTLSTHAKERLVDGPLRASRRLWEALLGGILALVTTVTVVFSFPGVGIFQHPTPVAAVTATSNVSLYPSTWSTSSRTTAAGHKEENKQKIPPPFVTKKPYDVSVRAIRGGRFSMEDEYFVGNGGRFAAVFDGHGGPGVSQFLKRTLYSNVNHFLEEKHWEEKDDDDEKCGPPRVPSVSCYVAALRAAFDKVEQDVVSDDNLAYQGSTAVAVVLHESEDGHRTLLSANVGDSRAVLSRKGRAVDLTRDHKPNDEKEKARIMAMGESLEWDQDCKVHRIRNLSLARAIGDRYAKPAVSSEVEIMHFPVSEGEDEFIVLASDGLWDVMTSQDVVTFVNEQMREGLANMSKENAKNYKLVLRRNMAKFLAREAIRKRSADNVSVLMVWL